MLAIAWLLRIFSYLFHFVLSLALLALGCVAVLSGAQNLKLDVLPWHGRELNHFLLLAGLVGLLSVILAMTGKFPYLFPLWSLAVVVMLVRGVFLSPAFTFTGPDQFKNALWLAAGALAAFAGSLTVFRRRERSPGPSRP
jgi:hypothetical protein